MDHVTIIGLISVAFIVIATIVPKKGQRHRAARIRYLLYRADLHARSTQKGVPAVLEPPMARAQQNSRDD